MTQVVVRRDAGEYKVWIALDDGFEPPDGLCFIIGLGLTRDEAVAAAVADLEAVLERLQGPASPAEVRRSPVAG